MRISLFSVPLILIAACTGSDPNLAGSSPAAGDAGTAANGSDASTGTSSVPIYGVFLSSQTLNVYFAMGKTRDDALGVADNVCTSLAQAAGVARSEHYQALVLTRDTLTQDDLDRLLGLREVDTLGGKWCAIAPGSPPRPSCAGTGVVFRTTDDITNGPASPLVTNESGGAASVQSHFLSGFYLDPTAAQADAEIWNCKGWSHSTAVVTDPPTGDDTFGVGDAVPRPATDAHAYRWLGDKYEGCNPATRYPLLCMEHP